MQNNEARIAVDFELIAERLHFLHRTINRTHVYELRVGLSKSFPYGLKFRAITTPRCMEHDEPGFGSNHAVRMSADNLSIVNLHVELDRTFVSDGWDIRERSFLIQVRAESVRHHLFVLGFGRERVSNVSDLGLFAFTNLLSFEYLLLHF